MFFHLLRFLASSLLTIAVFLGFSVLPSHADQRCRSVDFTITNGLENEIRVLRLRYRDAEDDRTRTNQIRNARIQSGEPHEFEETLEYVGNEFVPWIQIEYRERQPRLDQQGNVVDFEWSDRIWSNRFTGLSDQACVRNFDVIHTIL